MNRANHERWGTQRPPEAGSPLSPQREPFQKPCLSVWGGGPNGSFSTLEALGSGCFGGGQGLPRVMCVYPQ